MKMNLELCYVKQFHSLLSPYLNDVLFSFFCLSLSCSLCLQTEAKSKYKRENTNAIFTSHRDLKKSSFRSRARFARQN